MSPSDSHLVNAAIKLADLGYRVFPCQPNSKIPATAHGCLDATSDEDQIIEWWTMNPAYNIGVSTDGLLVVDVDPMPDGSQNEFASDNEVLADLLKNAGSATPRGGLHFWFRQPQCVELRNTASKMAQNVDTRATGGYVLAPPSVVDGKPYHWMHGFELEIRPDFLLPPPEFVLNLLDASKAASKRTDDVEVVQSNGTIPEGQRNATLTSIAGTMRRNGLSQDAIEAALRVINRERCSPMVEDEEVKKIAWSVSRYESDQIATAVAEGWAEQDKAEAKQRRTRDPGKLPESLLSPGGFLGDVIEWNLATAYKPQPELALAAALCLLATLTGRKVEDEAGTRTNLYCLGVCETGGGKEHARKINKAILKAAGLENLIGPEGIGSHQGIVSCLNANPVLLFQVDEFGRLLATLNNPGKSPHLFKVIDVLLKMFSASNSMYVGDAVADIKRIPRLDQPHAVLYGTTVPLNFLQSLEKAALDDGFIGRLLVFDSSNNDPDTQETLREAVPSHIVDEAAWWGGYSPGGNLASINPQPRALTYSPDAKIVLREFEIASRAQAKSGRETCKLWTRAVEKARKLAILHAVSLDSEATEIQSESVEWGSWIAHHLSARMEYLAHDWIAENQYEATAKRIMRLVKAAGDDGLSLTELTRKTGWINSKSRSEVLSGLELAGMLAQVKTLTGGRPKVVYKAMDS